MTRTGRGRAGWPARDHDRDVPLGIHVAASAVAVVVAAFVGATLPASAGTARLGVMALTLGVFAALSADPAAVFMIGVVAFSLLDGFLVNRLGELSWHGSADASRLWTLAAAAVCGLVVGAAVRALRVARIWAGRWAEVRQWADAEPTRWPAARAAGRE